MKQTSKDKRQHAVYILCAQTTECWQGLISLSLVIGVFSPLFSVLFFILKLL